MKNNKIANVVGPEKVAGEPSCQKVMRNHKRFYNEWIRRRNPTGIYNCAGMVWASRRTCIFDDEGNDVYDSIIKDDGLGKIEISQVVPGDIVVYRETETESIVHVARVCGCSGVENLRTIQVISKWDHTSGEYIHEHKNIFYRPYLSNGMYNVRIEYYSDRKQEDYHAPQNTSIIIE